MFLEAIEVNEEEGKKKTNFAFLSLRADGSDIAGAPVGAAPAPAVPAGQLSKQRMLQLLDGDGLGEMTCALRTPACARSTAQAEMIYKLARCVRFFLTLDDACVRQARLGLDLLTSKFSGGRCLGLDLLTSEVTSAAAGVASDARRGAGAPLHLPHMAGVRPHAARGGAAQLGPRTARRRRRQVLRHTEGEGAGDGRAGGAGYEGVWRGVR